MTSNPPIRASPIVQTLDPRLTDDTYDLCAALHSSEFRRLRTSLRSPCCMFISCTLRGRRTPLSHYRTRIRCRTCAEIITNSPCSLAPDGSGQTRFFPSILERWRSSTALCGAALLQTSDIHARAFQFFVSYFFLDLHSFPPSIFVSSSVIVCTNAVVFKSSFGSRISSTISYRAYFTPVRCRGISQCITTIIDSHYIIVTQSTRHRIALLPFTGSSSRQHCSPWVH